MALDIDTRFLEPLTAANLQVSGLRPDFAEAVTKPGTVYSAQTLA